MSDIPTETMVCDACGATETRPGYTDDWELIEEWDCPGCRAHYYLSGTCDSCRSWDRDDG